MINKFILGSEENIQKRSVFWNMIASTINAALSIFLLMIVTRVLGLVEAGVFSLAYSLSQMMLTIGLFDMRTYQATDVSGSDRFKYYFTSRVVTCICMLLGGLLYVLFKGYSDYKIMIVMLLCLLKMFDAFEDVFYGLFQQNGRLDVAGKLQSLRLISVIVLFCVTLFLTQNLTIAILSGIVVSILLVLFTLLPTAKLFTSLELSFDMRQLFDLFVACFPLFLGSYLALYIENSPKYAIDQFLQPEFQTYYGILFMPSYVINLFSSFAFRPMLTPMAKSWADKNFDLFIGYIKKLCLLVVAFTVVTLIGAFFLGIPVLSILYNADLSSYKTILMIFIIGGGINTIGVAIYYGITVMRIQKTLLIGYGISAVCAFIFSPIAVEQYGLMGGAIIFTILISIRVVCFFVAFVYKYRRSKKEVMSI